MEKIKDKLLEFNLLAIVVINIEKVLRQISKKTLAKEFSNSLFLYSLEEKRRAHQLTYSAGINLMSHHHGDDNPLLCVTI